MSTRGRKADKPDEKRKEREKTMPAGVVETNATIIKRRMRTKAAPFTSKKKEKVDALLESAANEFERQLILEWREDGMSDSEIQEWLKEI